MLGALTRNANVERDPLDDVLATVCRTASRTLGVERVNVWLYAGDRSAITCVADFSARSGSGTPGEVLEARAYPSYFEALDALRDITALDAENDPRTRELAESYLRPHGIGTMLDVPLLHSGQVIGVVCHEHVGPPREFSDAERLFAGSVGDLVSLVLETERRLRAERERGVFAERLARLQRLDGLGVLAGSVAHDFRNLLMVILASVEVASQTARSHEQHLQALEDIATATRRAGELCERLLSVSGRRPRAGQVVELGELVREVSDLLRQRKPSNVELETELRSVRVRGDATELRQVVANLVLNAFDAVSACGGRVKVSVLGQEQGGPLAPVFDFRDAPGASALLVVEDDGVGMSQATLERIFEPMFTTKPTGHGFGLASVLGALRAHRGALAVESREGAGTRFSLWLPRA